MSKMWFGRTFSQLVSIIIVSVLTTLLLIKQNNQPCPERRSGHNNERAMQPTTVTKQYLVPNIAHYNFFTNKPIELKFHELLGMLSVYRIMKPDKIFFHCNMEPSGKWWEEAKRTISNLVLVHTEPPTSLFGFDLKQPSFETSNSDVNRVQVMQQNGGVYLDLDILITSSLEPLRVYPATIGLEILTRVCGGFIMSAPNSTFLYLWINTMLNDYKVDQWAYLSGDIPTKLYLRFRHTGMVHVEPRRIHYPNYNVMDKLIGPTKFDWSKNYAVHLWHRIWKDSKFWDGVKEVNPSTIKSMNNTFGEIARMIYYNTTKLL